MPSNQQQIIEQAKFTYSPLGKAFENQTKAIEVKKKTKPHNLELKNVKEDVLNSARALLKGREMVYKAFESEIFLKIVPRSKARPGSFWT